MWDVLRGSLDCRLYPHPRSPLTCMRCVYKVSRATWCVSIISGCFLLILICSLFQIYLHNSQYPPLLQDHSRTLAIPYKELRHHRSPSESIGNNYSPRGQNLKIQHLQRRHHSLQCPPVARILNEHLIHTQPCLNTHTLSLCLFLTSHLRSHWFSSCEEATTCDPWTKVFSSRFLVHACVFQNKIVSSLYSILQYSQQGPLCFSSIDKQSACHSQKSPFVTEPAAWNHEAWGDTKSKGTDGAYRERFRRQYQQLPLIQSISMISWVFKTNFDSFHFQLFPSFAVMCR